MSNAVYPSNIEAKIGFDTIRKMLAERCESPMGVEEVERMEFSTDFLGLVASLRQTEEMKRIYESGIDLLEVSFNNLGSWLPTLKTRGAYAGGEQFARLNASLISFDNTRRYFTKRAGIDEDTDYLFPALAALFGDMASFPELSKAITRVVDASGLVKDSASPELAEVRQKLSALQGTVARSMQRIFAAAVKEGIADKDTAPTFRDGRMVIPVAAANKRRLAGIVHDESATGKTVFIEPAETVELSNRIREAELEEQRIVVKILTALSDEVRDHIDEILECNRLLGKLDFIMTKARFAIEFGGELPVIARHPEIEWYGAVHPVLALNLRKQSRAVVPLNIRLEHKNRFLIISGPNAGGKSVVLKTVAIVQYMCQCGLLPTLHSNSHVGFFNKIFIDIGDEQSIENDLSTYSSHLRNMRQLLLRADSRSLVLIDEIGSGTEPTIGSAIAKAILSELSRSRCFGIITTHYHNLKKFAEETDGFLNGAMLYDRQKLQPTFQLSIGNAGSSFALEIAGKIGLPKAVIEMAKADVGEDYVESDRFLMDIARDRKYWQLKRQNIKEREARLEQLEEKYNKLIAELNKQKKEIINEAKQEARELLSTTNKQIENTISEIRKAEAEKERTKKLRRELEEYKEKVENAEPETTVRSARLKGVKDKKKIEKQARQRGVAAPVSVKEEVNRPLEVGDYVKMATSTTPGRILSLSGKEAEVAFGNLRTKIKLSKLTRTSAPPPSLNNGIGLINVSNSEESRRRQLEFKDEIDIRGMRADEALDSVTRFIDDAIQFGVKKVRVLHGTGHGILRQLVRQQLGATPGIEHFDDEDVRLGGAGITVVTLR